MFVYSRRNSASVGEFDLLNLARSVLVTATVVVTPPLLAVAVVGLIVSLIQALTQVQEQSLSFVPKLLAGVLCVLIMGSWMLTMMVDLARHNLAQIGAGI